MKADSLIPNPSNFPLQYIITAWQSDYLEWGQIKGNFNNLKGASQGFPGESEVKNPSVMQELQET